MTLQLALQDYGQNPKARGKPPPPRRGYWVERVMPHPCWASASPRTCREGSRGVCGKIQNQILAPKHPPGIRLSEGAEQELGG